MPDIWGVWTLFWDAPVFVTKHYWWNMSWGRRHRLQKKISHSENRVYENSQMGPVLTQKIPG